MNKEFIEEQEKELEKKTRVTIDVINDNLKDCWDYYMDYRNHFIKRYYSDVDPLDFIEWCEDELYKCPNCDNIVLRDEQYRLNAPGNSDGVCDDCIENGGYYE